MNSPRAGGMMEQAIRHSAVYGATTILSRSTLLVALLVLPFILTPRDYGALSMIVTLAALVAIVVPLEVSQGLARFYPSASPREKRAYASSAWMFTMLMLAGFLAIGQALAEPLCVLILGDPAYLPAFRVALLLMTLNCVFYFLQNQCRWEFRTAQFVRISLAFSFLSLALSLGLGIVIDPPLVGVITGQALGAALATALGAVGVRGRFGLRIAPERLGEMLRFSLPLVPASVALFLSVYASRLVLNALLTLEEVGLYTLAAQIAGIASLGIVGVQAALNPLVMAHHQDPETPVHLARLFEASFGLAAVACLLLGLFAPELIHYVGDPDYARAAPLVILLAPGLLLAQMFVFAPGFAVAKRTLWQMWISLASAGIAIAANVWLIRLWGLTGAAVATLISGAAFLLLWFLLSHRLYPVPVRWGRIGLAAAAAALVAVAGAYLADADLITALLAKTALASLAFAAVAGLGLLPVKRGFWVSMNFLSSRLR